MAKTGSKKSENTLIGANPMFDLPNTDDRIPNVSFDPGSNPGGAIFLIINMKCILCKKEILNYDFNFNHLVIDESNSVDICEDFINKFTEWRGSVIAKLFLTNTMKKRFGKK